MQSTSGQDIGLLPNTDKHPPFRELMKHKHKAYSIVDCTGDLVAWLAYNVKDVHEVSTFLTVPVGRFVERYLNTSYNMSHLD